MTILRTIRLLNGAQRREGALLLICMMVGAALETVGVGLVVPALALITDADSLASDGMLGEVIRMLGDPDRGRLVLLGMGALVGLAALKTGFLGFVSWLQARFVARLQAGMSRRLFEGYVHQPYAFHLNRNSAGLSYNAIALPNGVAGVVQNGLVLVTEVMVLASICGLLLVLQPLGALATMTFIGGAGYAFNAATKSRAVRWGKSYKTNEALRYQHLQQGLGGVKELTLLGRDKDIFRQYQEAITAASRAHAHQVALQSLPRLWLELLAVVGMTTLVFILVQQGRPLEALLPTVGLFAAAAFRVLPSVNRILAAVHTFRFNAPFVSTLETELQLLAAHAPPPTTSPVPFERSLRLEGVSFRYPGASTNALTGIDLEIIPGTSIGFVGGSGAGKSTLVDVILGLLTVGDGAVLVDGVDIRTAPRGWQQQIGYVPQHIFLTDDTLRRNVAFGVPDEEINDQEVERAIAAAQLDDFVAAQQLGVQTIVGERGVRLSGGQRQRIGIARALYHQPSVLVLDEATSALDNATERGVMESVRALHGEKTVLIVAHRLSTVRDCDHVYRLEGGRIVDQGAAREVLVNLG